MASSNNADMDPNTTLITQLMAQMTRDRQESEERAIRERREAEARADTAAANFRDQLAQERQVAEARTEAIINAYYKFFFQSTKKNFKRKKGDDVFPLL